MSGIIIPTNRLHFITKDEANNKIYFHIGETAQAIVLLMNLENNPTNTEIDITFSCVFEGNPVEYSILSETNPATPYLLKLDTAQALIVPVPLPLKVKTLVANITNMDMVNDTLKVDFAPERSLSTTR